MSEFDPTPIPERKRVLVCRDDGGSKLEIAASFADARDAYAWLRSGEAPDGTYAIASLLATDQVVQAETVRKVSVSEGTRFRTVTRAPRDPSKPRKTRRKKENTQ